MEISRAFNLYMEYCRSKQLRQRTMLSYEQTIKLFMILLYDKLGTYAAVAREIGRSASSVSKYIKLAKRHDNMSIALASVVRKNA